MRSCLNLRPHLVSGAGRYYTSIRRSLYLAIRNSFLFMFNKTPLLLRHKSATKQLILFFVISVKIQPKKTTTAECCKDDNNQGQKHQANRWERKMYSSLRFLGGKVRDRWHFVGQFKLTINWQLHGDLLHHVTLNRTNRISDANHREESVNQNVSSNNSPLWYVHCF